MNPTYQHNNPSTHLWCIIMAGGLGSRFWPIAGADNPKQFIDVMGSGRTMLQSTFRRYAQLCGAEHVVVVTGEQYAGRVREQLPELEGWQVVGEPLRRNTAPCVAYAAAVVAARDPEATLVVTPSDHAIFHEDRFLDDLRQAVATVQDHDWIITLGAQPTRPETSYGYIQFREQPSLPKAKNLHEVVTFTEKPPVEMARQFIASGEFFWNAGIFVWTLPVLRRAYETFLPALHESFLRTPFDVLQGSLDEVYSHCETVSVDSGIMEKADNVHVLAASFGWSDVETWDSLYDVSPRDANGNAILGGNVFTYDTRNTLVAMPDDMKKNIVVEGLDGYIVAATDDTFMVCRRRNEEQIFRFANDVELKKLIDKQ